MESAALGLLCSNPISPHHAATRDAMPPSEFMILSPFSSARFGKKSVLFAMTKHRFHSELEKMGMSGDPSPIV